MHQKRHRRRGRLPKPKRIEVVPSVKRFNPLGLSQSEEPIFLESAELEALRLVDLEGLSQEDAGEKMDVSRGTIWRLLQSARKKVAYALSEGKPIQLLPYVDHK
jgi:predicted DNA-binding protein (UPF0251 family)